MAEPQEESEPLLNRARGGSGRYCTPGVAACGSVQVGPGEPRPGEGPGSAEVARGGPAGPLRVTAVASGMPPAGVRASQGGAGRKGAAFPMTGRLRPADP